MFESQLFFIEKNLRITIWNMIIFDIFRAIKMEPLLLDAFWHRHLLYILQDKKSLALDDLNYIMKHNKLHAGAYRSM